MRGKFIVFEGLDGSGCETQTKMIMSHLLSQGKRAVRITYPDYKAPIGNLIHDYLHNKHDLSVEVQLLLYATDMIKDKEKINTWLKEGTSVLADRYFTSTIAYQCMQGIPIEKALKFARLFEMPKPAKIFYLKISSDTSIQRKMKEKNSLDKHETNEKFLRKVSRFYDKLIRERVFGEWKVINGEQSVEAVFQEIVQDIKI